MADPLVIQVMRQHKQALFLREEAQMAEMALRQRPHGVRELAELEARWRRQEQLSSAPVVRSWPHARRQDR